MPAEPTAASTRNLRLQTPPLSLRSAQRKVEAPEDSNPENLTLQLTLHALPHSNTPSVPKKTLKRIKIKIKETLPPWCSFESSRFISPRSALGSTLVHSVQTRAKESLYRRHLLLVSHVCLSGHSIPLWKTKGWSVCLWYGKIVYLTWVFFLQGIILTATVFPPWLPGPWSLCESYLSTAIFPKWEYSEGELAFPYCL